MANTYRKTVAVVSAAQKELPSSYHARGEYVNANVVLILPNVHASCHFVVHVTLQDAFLVAPNPDQDLQLFDLRQSSLLGNIGLRVFCGALHDVAF